MSSYFNIYCCAISDPSTVYFSVSVRPTPLLLRRPLVRPLTLFFSFVLFLCIANCEIKAGEWTFWDLRNSCSEKEAHKSKIVNTQNIYSHISKWIWELNKRKVHCVCVWELRIHVIELDAAEARKQEFSSNNDEQRIHKVMKVSNKYSTGNYVCLKAPTQLVLTIWDYRYIRDICEGEH